METKAEEYTKNNTISTIVFLI